MRLLLMLVVLCVVSVMHITAIAQDDSEAKVKQENKEKLRQEKIKKNKKEKLAELKKFKEKWLAESKKHKGYTITLLSEFSMMSLPYKIVIKVMNDKIISVTKNGKNINKAEWGKKVRTMEQIIAESEKIIKNYDTSWDESGDTPVDLTLDIDGFKLNCHTFPKCGVNDADPRGILMDKFQWNDE